MAGRGGERRVAVLLHGFGQSARSWDAVAELLAADGWGISAVDWPGFGARRGERDAAAYSLEALCALLADEVRAVAAREGAAPVVVGYSMGGRVAAEALACGLLAPVAAGAAGAATGSLAPAWVAGSAASVDASAARPPAAIAGLVLESAGLGPRDAEARAALAARNAAWAADARARGAQAFMEDWAALPLFASQRALPADARACLAAARADNDAEALALSFEGSGAYRQSDEARTLAALRAAAGAGLPVLCLAGALDAKYAALARRAEQEGAARARVLPGAGHNHHHERPAIFAEELRVFLESARDGACATGEST